MENIQINGQKIWGPPRGWTGPPPPHGTEIYIKNLPEDVNEIELFQIFAIIGQVYEVRLPVHWSGVNRGYAFIRYTKISEADAAIKAFDGFDIRPGRTVKIERSVDNTRLFLSCVPNHKSSDDIKQDLQTVVDNVEKVYVYPTLENPSVYRGYAFVEFQSHRDAAIAKRILTPDVCFSIFDKKCVAAWANPLPFLNENVLRTINILFMRNVPKELKSITIKKAIENILGENAIQKVKRLNDFAFLTFKNHETAKAALDIIKRHPNLLGGDKIQIEWAVPRELTNTNTNSLDEWDHKKSNTSALKLKRNSRYSSYHDFESKDLFQIIDNENGNFNHFPMNGPEKGINSVEDLLGHKEAKFQKIWRESQKRFIELAKDRSTARATYPMNDLQPGITGCESGRPIKGSSFGSSLDSFPSSVSGSPKENSNNTWNLASKADLEPDDPFLGPQTKHWIGNFTQSCPTSPAFMVSPADSPVCFNFNDFGNMFLERGDELELKLKLNNLKLNDYSCPLPDNSTDIKHETTLPYISNKLKLHYKL